MFIKLSRWPTVRYIGRGALRRPGVILAARAVAPTAAAAARVSEGDAELLGELLVVGLVHVVEDGAAGELDLGEAEVDGDGLRDVEEAAVGVEGDGEAVERLEDVRALVLLEDVHHQVRDALAGEQRAWNE